MKKRIGLLALMLAVMLVTGAWAQGEAAEEQILSQDAAAVKLAVEMTQTMKAAAAEKAAAEPEDSKLTRFYHRIAKTSIETPYRAIILTPTAEQIQTLKTILAADADHKLAAGLATLVHLMIKGSASYAAASAGVVTEADAPDVGEDVVILLPCEDVVVVSIVGGKAQSAMIWGSNDDFDPAMIPNYTAPLGLGDLTFRNYDGEELKTLMGQ